MLTQEERLEKCRTLDINLSFLQMTKALCNPALSYSDTSIYKVLKNEKPEKVFGNSKHFNGNSVVCCSPKYFSVARVIQNMAKL